MYRWNEGITAGNAFYGDMGSGIDKYSDSITGQMWSAGGACPCRAIPDVTDYAFIRGRMPCTGEYRQSGGKMEQAEVPAVICFNKKDLASEEETRTLCETYRNCGYQVILSSALEKEGLDEIHRILKGKTTVVAGPSGVGKSSLTNLLQGEVQMETGEISRKLKRGRHTTRHSQVIPVGEDTFLMDTPGFSSLYLMNMEEQDLKNYFPEFRKYEDTCRFQGCRHIHEPGCRVKEALENGEISRLRYEDYLSLYEELKEKRRY